MVRVQCANSLSTTASMTDNAGCSMGTPKRLSWVEIQQRCEKNICFNCDEKFVRGHYCKNAQSLLIELYDGGKEDNGDIDKG